MQASKSKPPPKNMSQPAAPKARGPELRPRPVEALQLKAGVPITRQQMHASHIVLKSATHHCKFTNKPMYFCEVEQNPWNLRWVYSVPCGEAPGVCHEHIFLNDDDIVDKGGDQGTQSRNEVIGEWLSQMGWSRITSAPNQRFQCPRHRDPALIL